MILDTNVFKLLHSDFINHLPTTLDHPEKHDPLVLLVLAAGLLTKSFSRLYNQPMSAKTTTELQDCVSALRQWRSCLPEQVKYLILGQRFESLNEDDNAAVKLRLFFCYHECVYLLFGPWIPPLLDSLSQSLSCDLETSESIVDHKSVLADALGRCLESAYTIISHANEIVAADRTLARYAIPSSILHGFFSNDAFDQPFALFNDNLCMYNYLRCRVRGSGYEEKILSLLRNLLRNI